jgi:hypothetical protein
MPSTDAAARGESIDQYLLGGEPPHPLERTRDATSRLARAGDASNSTATDGQGE